MNLFARTIDLSRAMTLVYHLPNGPSLSIQLDGSEDFFDIDLEMGEICDTSEIDGVVHFFPRGCA
ncbi:MAG: hypothetical protein BWK76_03570 [Desulfobulbaceae bacterium A2]|nr:MAG: hypothetical protein BWK76_03570 [Desulfobulbaceae bacterium A2]